MSAGTFRPCVLIPTYDNPATLRPVVESVRAFLPDVLVVDDGSAVQGREAAANLERDALARVFRRPQNGGKGAAVKAGFAWARELGFSHALQVDADGQHAIDDIPRFLDVARDRPDTLVLGAPRFGADAPKGRLVGRQITCFWTNIETGGRIIEDPMCGFRVYPLAPLRDLSVRADRMDFDIEVAVRLVWAGVPVINLPTEVRYLSLQSGGVSHFRMVRDNVRISLMHSRLVCERVFTGFKAGTRAWIRRRS